MERADRRFVTGSGKRALARVALRRRAATPEEIARRRDLFAETARLRELIGPIGISSSELIRQVRDEAEGLTEPPESNG